MVFKIREEAGNVLRRVFLYVILCGVHRHHVPRARTGRVAKYRLRLSWNLPLHLSPADRPSVDGIRNLLFGQFESGSIHLVSIGMYGHVTIGENKSVSKILPFFVSKIIDTLTILFLFFLSLSLLPPKINYSTC